MGDMIINAGKGLQLPLNEDTHALEYKTEFSHDFFTFAAVVFNVFIFVVKSTIIFFIEIIDGNKLLNIVF